MRNYYAYAIFLSWYQSHSEVLIKLVLHSKQVQKKCCDGLSIIVIVSCFPMMSIRFEDRLDGIFNYIPWKVRITAVLKEWKIWSFANSKMTKPTNRDELEEFQALESRSQRVILNGVKDHHIPHLVEKKTTKDMWDTLK